jgi:hypothetical protein
MSELPQHRQMGILGILIGTLLEWRGSVVFELTY